MFRTTRVSTARHLAVLGALALACSDGSGPDAGGTTGAIVGTVSSSGTGVPGAGVALTGAGTANTTTSGTGTYSFNNLAPGSYTATITLPAGFTLAGGETAAKQATVSAGATATINWSATGGPDNVTTVTLSGTSFTPGNVTIAVGETVRWVVSNGSHTVTPDNPGQAGVWTGTGQLGAGDQFEHTFTTAGTYDYHCIPHQSLGMAGTITVQ